MLKVNVWASENNLSRLKYYWTTIRKAKEIHYSRLRTGRDSENWENGKPENNFRIPEKNSLTNQLAYSVARVVTEDLNTEIRKPKAKLYSTPSERSDWRPKYRN